MPYIKQEKRQLMDMYVIDIENLHLFNNKINHGICHGSLNKLVKKLLNKCIIKFDKNDGIYKILDK